MTDGSIKGFWKESSLIWMQVDTDAIGDRRRRLERMTSSRIESE